MIYFIKCIFIILFVLLWRFTGFWLFKFRFLIKTKSNFSLFNKYKSVWPMTYTVLNFGPFCDWVWHPCSRGTPLKRAWEEATLLVECARTQVKKDHAPHKPVKRISHPVRNSVLWCGKPTAAKRTSNWGGPFWLHSGKSPRKFIHQRNGLMWSNPRGSTGEAHRDMVA